MSITFAKQLFEGLSQYIDPKGKKDTTLDVIAAMNDPVVRAAALNEASDIIGANGMKADLILGTRFGGELFAPLFAEKLGVRFAGFRRNRVFQGKPTVNGVITVDGEDIKVGVLRDRLKEVAVAIDGPQVNVLILTDTFRRRRAMERAAVEMFRYPKFPEIFNKRLKKLGINLPLQNFNVVGALALVEIESEARGLLTRRLVGNHVLALATVRPPEGPGKPFTFVDTTPGL